MARLLDYARPRDPDKPPPRHPAAAMLLMVLCAIGFLIIGGMGLFCMDALGLAASGMMIFSAAFMLIAVFGFLSRQEPAFLAAAIMTVGALAGAAFCTLLTHSTVTQMSQRAVKIRTATPTIVIVERADSDYQINELARTANAGGTGLAFCLLVYLAVQSFQRRPE